MCTASNVVVVKRTRASTSSPSRGTAQPAGRKISETCSVRCSADVYGVERGGREADPRLDLVAEPGDRTASWEEDQRDLQREVLS
ncbi:MAG: hypothetical protein WKF76_04490 [Nocardioidaceae bacterium]